MLAVTPAASVSANVSVTLLSECMAQSRARRPSSTFPVLPITPSPTFHLLTLFIRLPFVFFFYTAMIISSLVPTSAPLEGGGWLLTVSGSNFGSDDIVSVSVAGVAAPAHTWQSSTRVVVRVPAASVGLSAPVALESASYGVGVSSVLFTYNNRTSVCLCFVFDLNNGFI